MNKKISLLILAILVGAAGLSFMLQSENKVRPPLQVYSHQLQDLLSDRFAELDKNHDNFLDKEELAGTFFETEDLPSGDKVSIIEFVQRAEEIFRISDKDENHLLEADELHALLGLN